MNRLFSRKQFTIKNNKTHWQGELIDLSDKGHACLILFLQSDQQIISKEFLIKNLWAQVVVSDDSLFKVIQEVRKSLRQLGFQSDTIINVYGKGYQWTVIKQDSKNKQIFGYSAVVTLLLVTGLYWYHQPKKHLMNEVEFTALVSQLKHGVDVDLHAAFQNSNPHPLDQLRKAYLIGFQFYQSGDYEQSIKALNDGISIYGNNETTSVLADSYLLLSKMYIYRDDKALLKTYLDQAQKLYHTLEDPQGVLDTRVEKARYHQTLHDYATSIVQLNEILVEANNSNNTKTQLRVLANLAYSYEQTQQPEAAIKALEETLELALSASDGDYAAYAHGALSTAAMKTQNYGKAMKYAQAALQYSLSQHDTNQFQQSFSAFYLLLLPLGHVELADKYLDYAIQIQDQFNAEGVLYHAEIQRIESLTLQHQYTQSRDRLKDLMSESLNNTEKREVQALYAYNSHFLKDNINAYTQAKPILENPNSNLKTRIYAGMAFVLSAEQLERTDEAKSAFQLVEQLITNQDNTLYIAYLDMLSRVPISWIDPVKAQMKATAFEQRMAQIQTTTTPKQDLLKSLDSYIENITLR